MAVVRELITRFIFDMMGTDIKVENAINSIKANLRQGVVEANRFTGDLKRGLAGVSTEAVAANAELRRMAGLMRNVHGTALTSFHGATGAVHGFRGALWEIVGILGLGIGLHQVVEMSDQWSMVSTTIKNATTSATEYRKVMDGIYKQSQTAGVSMEGPSNLYAQIASARGDNHLNDQQILRITDTVTKALALGHRSNSSNMRSIRQVDDFFALGKITQQHLTALTTDSPMLARFLREAAGGAKALHEMVKSGKADSKYIIDLFNKMGPQIDANFSKMGITFQGAAQRIKNAIEDLWGRLFVETGIVSNVLKGVVDIFEDLHDSILAASDAVGGFTNLAELAAIAFAAAFGPAAIRALAAFTVRMWQLAAANLAAIWQWALIAAGILAAGLAIQDIITWMRGGNSIVGDWLGSFKLYEPYIRMAEDALRAVWRWVLSIVNAVDWRAYGREIMQAFRDAFGSPETRSALHRLMEAVKTLVSLLAMAAVAAIILFAKIFAPIARWALLGMVESLVAQLELAFNVMSKIIQLMPSLKADDFISMLPGGDEIKALMQYLNATKPKKDPTDDTQPNDPPRREQWVPQAGPSRSESDRTGSHDGVVTRTSDEFRLPRQSTYNVFPQTLITPGVMMPPRQPGGQMGGLTITNTNNISVPNGDPATIGAGISDGMNRGLNRGLAGRGLATAFPGAEFGVI